jgi:AcrR family transcriptional regulator
VASSTAGSSSNKGANGTDSRPRGRPRRDIDPNAVATAVAELFAEGGFDAVSIGSTAEKLSVSRATLYRTVPTKEHLLGILFEISTRELTESAAATLRETDDPTERLHGLIGLHVRAAIQMRRYMPVFFGGTGLPSDVYGRWHEWSRGYEALWQSAVSDAMDAGVLRPGDPLIATRLLLGMCIWVSRWYRTAEGFSETEIAQSAISLLQGPPPTRHSGRSGRPARAAAGTARSGGIR